MLVDVLQLKSTGTPNSSLMPESVSSKPAPLKNQGIKSAIIFLLRETPSFSCARSELTRKRGMVTDSTSTSLMHTNLFSRQTENTTESQCR